MRRLPRIYQAVSQFAGTVQLHLVAAWLFSTTIASGITENQVLVVYNSQNPDSQAVRDYYLTKRTGVLTLDLTDSTLSAGNISYSDFATKIRNPIRTHLNTNNLEQSVHVIVLTKGIPHRIQSLDTSSANVGDNASATISDYNAGNANFASVDSELTLLQFNLEAGESSGDMDSIADRAVTNPYFDQTDRFNSYSRNLIANPNRSFSEQPPYGWWQLYYSLGGFINKPADAGHIYLTSRLDASTVEEVKAMIDRAQNITFRRDLDAILLDADARAERLDTYTHPINNQLLTDYQETASTLDTDWLQLLSDDTTSLITGASNPISYPTTTIITGPVAHLHSYGVNHIGSGSQIRDYLATFTGQLVPGASFSAYESFGAKGLGGLSHNGQAQIEEWITAGGTFATGPVWEPFTFGILKSEIFLDRFFNQNFTYVEAAWCAILQLSWQTTVLGDPLATASFIDASAYEEWTFDQAGSTSYINAGLNFESDFESDGLANGLEYIFELDPTLADASSDRILSVTSTSSPQLDFTISPSVVSEVTLEIEMSTTLASDSWTIIAERSPTAGWSGSATIIENSTIAGLEVSITDQTPGIIDKRFYRLSANLNP
jgi:uncharacterized protein (TIGR03790 family)